MAASQFAATLHPQRSPSDSDSSTVAQDPVESEKRSPERSRLHPHAPTSIDLFAVGLPNKRSVRAAITHRRPQSGVRVAVNRLNRCDRAVRFEAERSRVGR